MFKIYSAALAMLFAGTCVIAQNPDQKDQKTKVRYIPKARINTPEYKVSNFRIDQIKTLLNGKFNQRVNLADPAVRKRIEAEINRIVPLTPRVKADSRTVLDIKKALEGKVNAKYSKDLKTIKQEAEQEFDKRNPFAKVGSRVTIRYKRGSRYLRTSGVYYGRGVGDTLKINSRSIPVIDLLEDSKLQFDPVYHASERSKYANGVVNKYVREKNMYADKLIRAEYAKVHKKNEQLGYILRNGWEPAKNIVNDYYEEVLERYKVRAEEEARKRAEQLKNNPVQAVVQTAKPAEEDEEEDEE